MTFFDRAHVCPWRGFVHERHEGHKIFSKSKLERVSGTAICKEKPYATSKTGSSIKTIICIFPVSNQLIIKNNFRKGILEMTFLDRIQEIIKNYIVLNMKLMFK